MFGLPFDYHVDEWPYVVQPALVLRHGGVDTYLTPFSMLVVLEYAALALVQGAAVLAGIALTFGPVDGAEPAIFIVLGRLTSVLLGTATIIPIYLLGRQWWGDRAGLLAALIFSLDFLAVRNSHYGVPDTTGAFLAIVSAYFATKLAPHGQARHYVLAGFAAGLAIAVRPLTLLIFLPALLYHFRGRSPVRRVSELLSAVMEMRPALYVGALTLGFLIGTPLLLVDPISYAKVMVYELRLGQSGGFGSFQVIDPPGWLFYLTTLRWGIGDVALGLGLVGAIWIVLRQWRGPGFLFTFPIATFLYLGATNHAFARYLLPVLPFLALSAAFAAIRFLTLLRGPAVARVVLGLGLAAALLFQPLRLTLQHDRLLTLTDTRTLAIRWIEENLPDGATIAREWFTPALSGEQLPQRPDRKHFKVLVTSVFGLSGDKQGTRAGARTLEDYETDGVQYVVSSSFASDVRMLRPAEDARKQAFYHSLATNARLLQEFKPHAGALGPPFIFDDIYGPAASAFELERPGPVIRIYELTAAR